MKNDFFNKYTQFVFKYFKEQHQRNKNNKPEENAGDDLFVEPKNLDYLIQNIQKLEDKLGNFFICSILKYLLM